MRYLALIYGNKEIWNDWPDRRAVIAEVDAFNTAPHRVGRARSRRTA